MCRKLLILLTLVGAAYLNGCASVPMASLESDTARKDFPSPTPGTAGLYIYRNTNLGGALKKDIFIDGELVAETAPMTYFYFEVQGGKRKLSTESEFSANDLVVYVEKDKNYFVRQSMKLGLFVGGANLELVPEEEGKKGVLECKLGNNFNGNVMVNTEGIETPVLASQSEPGGEKSALDYYGQAEEEINTQTYDKNLWAKALVETEGDQTKRKARYIELRANQLYSENVGSISESNLSEQPVSNLNAKPTSGYDVTGTYSSKIAPALWRLNLKSSRPEVKIHQTGNNVKGTFGKGSGEFDGVIVGDTITIEFYTARGTGKGKWTIIPESNQLIGSFGANVKWNLKKIQ